MMFEPQEQSETLDDFLEQQGSEGSRDSVGAFTIDIKMAERKLGAFQMPTPQSWALVLVQGAHRSGARDIKVTQTLRRTTFQISGAESWTWEELQTVLDGASTTNGAVLAYAVVVRALIGNQDIIRFRVRVPDGTSALWRAEEWRVEHQRVEDLLLAEKTVFEVEFLGEFPEKRSPFFETRRCAREQLVAITQALVRSCFASAVPITVDGLKIPGLHLGHPLPPHQSRFPLALLSSEDYRIPSVAMSAALDSAQDELLEEASISDSSRELDSETAVSAVAALSLVLKREKGWLGSGKAQLCDPAGESRLVWIQDGVIVGSESLNIPGSLELTVILSAAGLQTDLSGLKLIRNAEMEERERLLRELLSARLTRLVEESQDGDLFALHRINEIVSSSGSWLGRMATLFAKSIPPELEQQAEVLEADLGQLPQRFLSALT